MMPRLDVSISLDLPGFALDVEWSTDDGVVALFGPEGAGKTLTLRCLAGLVRPSRGRIVVDGRVLFDAATGVDVPPDERRIAHVPAGGGLADPALLLLDEPLSAGDRRTREGRREELRAVLAESRAGAVVATGDFADAYRLGDRIVVYEDGRVIQAAPRAELLWRPGAESVARIIGVRNILHGTVLKASPDRIQLQWRGQTLETVNSPSRAYLPLPGSPIAFFIRPEYVRLIRKDRGTPDRHHMNLMSGTIVRQADFGTTWTLAFRLDEPGPAAQGTHDLEVEVPRMVHEILELDRDHHWQFSIHRGSIQVLPA
jgi:ABC-type sulfate/molybdate transport systems ATPase subunit